MTTYPFSYKVVIVDPLDQKKHLKECGIGFCTSFTNAACQLEDYYGQDIYKIIDLQLFEENDLLITTEQFVDEYANTEYCDYAIPCDHNGNTVYAESENVEALTPKKRKTQLNVDFKFKDEPSKESKYDSTMRSL